MCRTNVLALSIVCLTIAGGFEPASAQHFDVFVAEVGGKIGLGAADVDGASFSIETLVFEGELEENLAMTAWEGADPGFFGLSSVAAGLFPAGASALPASSDVVIDLQSITIGSDTSELFYWDGFGSPSFGLPAAATLVSLAPNAAMATGVNGELDYHPTFRIENAGAPSAVGIYLVAVRVSIPTSALAASDPLYIVFGTEGAGGAANDEELDEVIDAGISWVEVNLVVPEPSAAAMATVIGCILVCARRPIRDVCECDVW